MAHGLTQAGDLDLDDLGAQLAQVTCRAGSQDVLSTRQDPVAFQGFRFFKKSVLIEDGFAIVLKG